MLVIIGLLLGGILKGQEMITQARIKNVINDFNGITAAYASYQDRYRGGAGRRCQAGQRWSGICPPRGLNAGSTGQIGGLYALDPSDARPGGGDTTPGESRLFWWHLRLAGFVPAPRRARRPTVSRPTP